MSHTIYTTEAIVIKSRNQGEANRYIYLLTADLGLVRAVAQGVRLQKSKLKFGLQEGLVVRVSLVRGREVWRITSVAVVQSLLPEPATVGEYQFLGKVCSLVARLVSDEEVNHPLYINLKTNLSGLTALRAYPHLTGAYELHTVLSLLSILGYIDETGLTVFNLGSDLSATYLEALLVERSSLVRRVNSALEASHL